MPLARRAFIIGGSHTPFIGKGHPDFIWKKHPDFGTRANPNLEEHLKGAVDGALEDTGVDAATIDRLYVGNFLGELFSNQGHLGSALVGSHPDLSGKPAARLEGACASGGLAVLAGLDAIAAGADTILVAGVEVQTTQSARVGADYLARAAHYRRQREIDEFTFPALFAGRIKAYRERFGATEEDLGRVSVKAYGNANKNPKAHMCARKMSLDVAGQTGDRNPCFLEHDSFSPFLRMSDCSQVSDGASALVLVSEEGLKAAGLSQSDAVEVVSTGHAVSSLYTDGDRTELQTSRRAVEQAYSGAGIGAKDVEVAEVHDCFSVTELMMYEAMDLCAVGEGASLIRDGATDLGGRVPVNTGGGLIGFGHPVGATGVKQPLEVFRQMKGRCGDYQLPSIPTWGVTVNMGGDDKTVVSMAIRNLQ